MDDQQSKRLINALTSYDGKSVEPFRQVSRELAKTEASILDVLHLVEKSTETDRALAAIEIGATWVVKDLIEAGALIPRDFGSVVISLLGQVEATDARLHLLQILPHTDWPAESSAVLFARLVPLAGDANTFIRAWSINALGLLAECAPEYRQRVLKRFESVVETEKPAVKVRMRKARERLLKAEKRENPPTS